MKRLTFLAGADSAAKFSRPLGSCASIAIGLALLAAVAVFCSAQNAKADDHAADHPTTAPAYAIPAPATQPADPVQAARLRKLLVRLGDDDPDIRQSARSALLSLSRTDLPTMRDVLKTMPTPAPGEIADIHDIAVHLFLSGEAYPATADGFLGLHWLDADPSDSLNDYGGIVVDECMPGFCAYRMLRAGDIIVQIVDQPNLDLHLRNNFVMVMATHPAGDMVRFKVVRNGKRIEVPIILDAKPANIDPLNINQFINPRMEKAEQFWQAWFGWLDTANNNTIGDADAPGAPYNAGAAPITQASAIAPALPGHRP
jgi:hypothetical protein